MEISKTAFKRIFALAAAAAMLLALPLYAFAAGSESQHVNYITDIFNEEKGLPTGEANTIVQAADGYLWIGSYGGLIRHDGSNFVEYGDRLESTAIRALYSASDGKLYIGTNDGGAYYFENDTFTRLNAPDENSFLCVKDFAEGPDGKVYLSSTSGVGSISGTEIIPFGFDMFENEHPYALTVDGQNNVWSMSDAGNVYIIKNNALVAQLDASSFFSEGSVYAVETAPDGSVWVGSSGNSVRHLRLPENWDGDLARCSMQSSSTGDAGTVNRLNATDDGRIMASCINGFGYFENDGIFRRVDSGSDNALSANWAECDHEGNFWIASSNYGVIRYSVGCFDSCNYNSDLGEHNISSVTRSGSYYYVGTDTGLLVMDEDWTLCESSLSELLEGSRVRTVAADRDGKVWVGTQSAHGAVCYDPDSGNITEFNTETGLRSTTVRVLYPLADGRMLIGHQLGVSIVKNGKIVKDYGETDGMETTSVLCAMQLGGRIYVGTDGSGIYEITDSGLRNLSFNEGLTQGVVLRMGEDADNNGNFFVCAGDKLFYCENDRFRVLNSISKGAGSIYNVYDKGGRVWILQNGGVFSIDKAQLLADDPDVYTAQYGVKCGLTGTLAANTWSYLDEDGAFYIPTRNGISLFYFRGKDVVMPRAIVNSVTVDDVVYEHPQTLDLPRDAQRITVDISALLFSETNEFWFGYRLDGFDAEETVTRDKHVSVSYTNLKGGNYTLEMRIIDPLTGESTIERSVLINKAYRLTELIWFWILMAVAFVGVVILISSLILRSRARKAAARQAELQNIIIQAMNTISGAIDAKDEYTNGHSTRVATYAQEIARRMGLPEEQVENIYYIGLLHDIGKIGVPDHVLNKKTKLSDEEYQIIKSHPAIGGKILAQFNAIPGIADGAQYHHERYDGRGYCKGLAGEDIPLTARIIGVADSYDAMESNRVYRPGMTTEKIISELRNNAGTQFDPKAAEIMCQLIEEGFAPITYTGKDYDYNKD